MQIPQYISFGKQATVSFWDNAASTQRSNCNNINPTIKTRVDLQRWNFKLMSISKMQNIAELSNKQHTYQHPLHFILAAWLSSIFSANNCVRHSPASWISWSGYRQHTRSTASMTSYQWPHVGSLSIVPRTLFWLARVNDSEE